MDYEIFSIFQSYTLEVVLIALGSCILTYFIKIPIKKMTSKLIEPKAKMVNMVIMFIPLLLSSAASIIYYGLTINVWMSFMVLDSIFSSWILSLSMYAVSSRIYLLFKGIKSGKVVVNSDLAKDTINYVKKTIKQLNNENKIKTKNLNDVSKKLVGLIEIRDILLAAKPNINLNKVSELNTEINGLEEEKSSLESIIKNNKSTIETYNEQLYVKTK